MPCLIVLKLYIPKTAGFFWAGLLCPVPSKARALCPVWDTIWDIQLVWLWLNWRSFRNSLYLFSLLKIMALKEKFNKWDVRNIKRRIPRRTCLQVHMKTLQEVDKHLPPIFMRNRTCRDCIRLKKFFQTKDIIKHWSITSGEIVNSSSLETFKNQLGKHLPKLP